MTPPGSTKLNTFNRSGKVRPDGRSLGCAQREWLIISGTHRGTIWSDCRADDRDLAPLLDQAGHPVTFTYWYIDWLQKAELSARRQPSHP